MLNNKFLSVFVIALTVLLLAACDKVDNKSLPGYMVRIPLSDYGRWTTYGVSGVGEYRIFNREKKLPSNYPYDATTYTGFGGVLLMMGIDMKPIAYDMACPIEARADVVISINSENFEAYCPNCDSRYNILTGSGGPISGMALNNKKGLTPYAVNATGYGGYLITNR